MADGSPEMVKKIHMLSDGRPILIALSLDWLARGGWSPDLYPIGISELLQRKARSDTWGQIQSRFERSLVGQIRKLTTPLDEAVRYVAICRKGCNTDLLARLMNLSRDEASTLIVQLVKFSFVKALRPDNRDMFFLHDEMYDLVEKYVWLEDYGPDYEEQARLDEVVITWYTEQLDRYSDLIRASRDWSERGDLRREQQLLYAERLYYQFDQDPSNGYLEYTRLDEVAIAAREREWDTWLRNEALWFTSHRAWRGQKSGKALAESALPDPLCVRGGSLQRGPTVDRDCRRRWINRYIAKGKYQEAISIALALTERIPFAEAMKSDYAFRLHQGGLHIAMAMAYAYQGGAGADEAPKHAEDGIKLIQHEPQRDGQHWLDFHLLGVAYLARGMALRSQFRWSEAAEDNEQAARCFKQSREESRIAEAYNNQAYVLARSGRLFEAWRSHETALDVRVREGDEYPLGLSLNTAGLIHERSGNYTESLQQSSKALELFTTIGSTRGIALAAINMGRSLRRMGRAGSKPNDSNTQNIAVIQQYFVDAEKSLLSACDYFDRTSDEKDLDSVAIQEPDTETFYAVEVRNELGCLHRDWVAALYDCNQRDMKQLIFHLQLAEKNLKRAQDLIGTKDEHKTPWREFHYVDVTEDLARVYFWWGNIEPDNQEEKWNLAESWLEKATRLTENFTHHHEHDFFIGKIHHQYGRISQARGKEDEAARHYALAAGYLEKYSPYLPELSKTIEQVKSWLRNMSEVEQRRCLDRMQIAWQREYVPSPKLGKVIQDILSPASSRTPSVNIGTLTEATDG